MRILHLCAGENLGSDSHYYDIDEEYEVIRVGVEIGVENYSPTFPVHGIFANPVCTEFSTVAGFDKVGDLEKGMFLVNHCQRIIDECKAEGSLKWWVMENPAKGRLHECIGQPDHKYQPWQYGSPWTKWTALWGEFIMPPPTVKNREDVELICGIYIRPRDTMPSLAILHKSAVNLMPCYDWAKDHINSDSDLRSMCGDGFAKQFKKNNP